MYIKRHIEEVLKTAINEKGAICITGARQVGKSTVLKRLFTEHRELTLDEGRLLMFALERPEEFFEQFEPPVFIDEIQYAPSLFPYIKMHIDKTGARGAFMLSGSQRYEMMSNVTESLAGRVNLIDLYGLSMREILHRQGYFSLAGINRSKAELCPHAEHGTNSIELVRKSKPALI